MFIKIGNDIHNEQDVQNLITAIILRQRGEFTKQYLIKTVKHFLPAFEIVNDNQIKEMINDTLIMLSKYGKIRHQNGSYYSVKY